jgi:hypothetical protein
MSSTIFEASQFFSEIAERIEKYRVLKGFRSRNPFCDHIEYNLSNYHNYLARTRKGERSMPPMDLLVQLHKTFRLLNFHWMFTGEGDIELPPQEDVMDAKEALRIADEKLGGQTRLNSDLMKQILDLREENEKLKDTQQK